MRAIATFILVCALPVVANAQSLTPTARANYGMRSITPGFAPDPFVINVTSGGSVAASNSGLGVFCSGYVTQQPDFNLQVAMPGNFLRFFVEGGGQDTTLIVRSPNGQYACNDDTFGNDPSIDINSTMIGVYNVWVGSYRAGDRAASRLNVTQRRDARPGMAQANPQPNYPVQQVQVPVQQQAAGLMVNGRPNFGSRAVTPNFMPDPLVVSVTSGGNVAAATAGIGNCSGYVTAQPDFNLTLNGYDQFLRFYVEGRNQDTTLIVNDPMGQWHCNDDTWGNDPGVDIVGAQAGVYNVWVGSFRAGTRASAQLNITELNYAQPGFNAQQQVPQQPVYQQPQYAPPPQPAASLNPNQPANYGGTNMALGSMQNTNSVRILSGGSIEVERLGLGAGCTGYVTAAPDYNIAVANYGPFMRILVDAGNADTTLVIQQPNGSWACNDDAFSTTNPGLDFNGVQPGLYHVWVGSFRAGTRAPGTLTVTERNDIRPGNAQPLTMQAPQQQQQQQQVYVQRPQVPAGALNPGMAPNFGTVAVTPNFVPDPVAYNVSPGGGTIDARTAGLPVGCSGWVNANPDMTFSLTGFDSYLKVFMTATDGSDTTMIVRTPNGAWLCNDDDEGRNPAVELNGAQPGMYQVWIGQFTYQNGRRNSGTLAFTEMR